MSVQRILVGVDRSPGSATAMAWAAELARDLGALVTAVHAFVPLDHLAEVDPEHSFTRVRNELEVEMRTTWCQPLTDHGVAFDAVVVDGEPHEVIIDTAREHDVDLIVLGARRQGLVRRLALGSTSQHVLRHSRRPVTILHPDED